MSNPIDLSPLTSFLSTNYHVREVLAALDHLQTAFFKKNQPFLQTLEQEVPFPLSETLKKMILAHHVELANTADLDTFLTELREAIAKMPRLTLTVATEPTLQLIKEIHNWLLLNVKQAVILDFVVDSTIIAGAKINFNGQYKDHSIKKQMESFTQTIQN